MPRYSVVGDDGRKYNVEARAGLSEYELQSLVAEHVADREYNELLKKRDELARAPVEKEEPKRTLGGYAKEILKGIPSGAIGLLETAGTGIAAALPEETEKAAREKISGLAAIAKKPFEAAPGYEESVARKLSEGVGSTAPFFLLGPAGLAGRAGIGALAAGAGAGEARVRAEQAGATEEERRSATGLGTVVGIGELLAPFGADKVVGRLRRIATAGGIEGAQEAASELAQNMIERGIYNPEKEIIAGTGEAGAYGAGVGALTQALLDMALPGRTRGAAPKPEQPPGTQLELLGPPPAPPGLPRPEFEHTPPEAPSGEQLELDLQPKAETVPSSVQPDMFGAVDEGFIKDLTDAYIEAGLSPEDARRVAVAKASETEQRPEEEPRGNAPATTVGEPAEPVGTEPSVGVPKQPVGPESKPVSAAAPEAPEPPRLDSDQAPAGTGVGEEGAVQPSLTDVLLEQAPELQPSQLMSRTRVKKRSKPLAPKEEPKVEEQTPESFAQSIAKGKKLDTPSDLQYYQNNAEAIEAELKKLQAETAPPKTEAPKTEAPKTEAQPAKVAVADIVPEETKLTPKQKEAVSAYINSVESFTGGKGDLDKVYETLAGDIYYALAPTRLDVGKTNEILEVLSKGEIPRVDFGRKAEAPHKVVAEDKGKRAATFLKSLSPAQTKTVADKVAEYFKTEKRARLTTEAREKEDAKQRAYTKKIVNDPNAPDKVVRKLVYTPLSDIVEGIETDDSGLSKAERELASKYLAADEVFGAPDINAATESALQSGNLVTALVEASKVLKGRLSRIAKRISAVAKSTKIEVVDKLKDESGNRVAGLFDPKTNTIKLDSKLGLNYHTLLHESGHAATAATLANKSHPLTKQLTKLYESVKDSLGTAYGAQSLEEFVAEAWSNPKFQEILETISPDGKPLSAWQRFKNLITNFFRGMLGLDSKAPGSALDAVDALVADILAPAPEYRDAGALYQAAGQKAGGRILDGISSMVAKLPAVNKPWADNLHSLLTSIPNLSKRGILQTLPQHAFVEVAKEAIPKAMRLKTLVDEKHGSEAIRNRKIDATIRDAEAWAKKNPSLVDTLNDIVYTSTVEQVDPSKPASTYANDDAKMKVWDDLQDKWKALGKDGREQYERIRDTYKAMYLMTRQVLDARLDGLPIDKTTKEKIKKDFYQKLFENGVIEPYFPLTRTGKNWLSYTYYSERTGNLETFVELFENPAARERAINELKAEALKDPRMKQQAATLRAVDPKLTEAEAIEKLLGVQSFAKVSEYNYRKAPSTSFISNIISTMEKSKVGAADVDKQRIDQTIEQVMETFLTLLPETSFAQSFRRRKNTEGYNRDVIGALKSKGYALSRQLANIEYGAKLEQLAADIREDYKKSGSPEDGKAYFDEINKRIDFAKSPEIPEWSKIATSIGFGFTLGANVSSALINLSQIPLVVVPYLAFGRKHGLTDTIAAIGRASRIFIQSGTTREMDMLVGNKKIKARSMPSIDNMDLSKDPKLAHLKILVEEAERMGKLNRSMTQDILEFDDKSSFMAKVNAVSGFLFHHGERMNRQVALVAAYELNLKKSKTKDEAAQRKAAQEALYDVELTNGGTASEAVPTIAQSGLGKIIFMYKNYGVSMYYMLFKAARQALKDTDPEVRKAAWGQIAGIYGSAALFAGARGLPMMGALALVYNMFTDDDEDDFENALRKYLGELKFNGAINYLTNLEVGSRIGLSDLLFRDSTVKDQDSVLLSLMETVGGPVFGLASRWERGIKLINEGHAERGIEQMLPSSMGNALKSIRYATEGTQTLRGDPITGEVSAWNAGAQFFGFAPANYIQQLEINSQNKGIERSVVEERTKILKRYYMALKQGDTAGSKDILEDLTKFNKKHPNFAITGETVRDSIAQHMRTSASMIGGVSYNKRLLPEMRARIAEYERDIDED